MRTLLRFLVFLWVAMAAPLVQAVTMVYPVDAINDLWQLPADEFRQKYAGINVSGLGPSDEGWYVRYRHENLTYLFGPLADREEARKRKWDMETVRDAAIRNRSTLASSQVDFVRFTFSAVYGKGGGGAGGSGASGLGRISADGRSGPDGDLDGDGIPNALDPDMDGDGIPNELDDDIDGDGIPNAQDDYGFGTMDAKIRAGTGLGAGGDGKSGSGRDAGGGGGAGGDGESGQMADRSSGKGGKGGRGGQAGGESGQGGEGGEGGDSGQIVGSRGGLQQVASAQGGSRGGQQGGMGGQQGGQGGQQGGQQGSQGGQSGSSGQQGGGQQGGGSSGGQSGGGGSPGGGGPPGGGSSGGGGNPLQLVSALLRMILGL